MSEIRSIYAIALGANLNFGADTPEITLRHALRSLSSEGCLIRSVSRFFSTPCFPVGAGPDYVNAAALVESARSEKDFLALLHTVEHAFGRARAQRWGMRTLDLDIAFHGDHVSPDPEFFQRWASLSPEAQAKQAPDQLILPHPRLQDRAFVLFPLADIVPDWRHPVLGRTVLQMLHDLPEQDRLGVVPI